MLGQRRRKKRRGDGARERERKRERESGREVCRLLYEADLDRRRGLDTLCLWRDTVTAAVDCVCMCTFMYVYSRVYDGVQFCSLYANKMSPNPLKSGECVCARACVALCMWRKDRQGEEIFSQLFTSDNSLLLILPNHCILNHFNIHMYMMTSSSS